MTRVQLAGPYQVACARPRIAKLAPAIKGAPARVIEADRVEVMHVRGKRMLYPAGPPNFKAVQPKTRFFPAEGTQARQTIPEPEAGRKNGTLFSSVISSRSSETIDGAAPPQVWSARVISAPPWINPCCWHREGVQFILVSHQP